MTAEIRDRVAMLARVLPRVARAVDKRVKPMIGRRMPRMARLRGLAWARAGAGACVHTSAHTQAGARSCGMGSFPPLHPLHPRQGQEWKRVPAGEGAPRVARAVAKGGRA